MTTETATEGRRLRLLLWKNFLVQKRSKYLTIGEFALPILVLIPLIFFALSGTEYHQIKYDAFPVYGSAEDFDTNVTEKCANRSSALVFSPTGSSVVEKIVDDVAARLELASVKGFENETQLIEFMHEESTLSQVCGRQYYGAVVFESDLSEIGKDDGNGSIVYKIRLRDDLTGWSTHGLTVGQQMNTPRNPTSPVGGPPDYWYSGFLILQRAVDLSIISEFVKPGQGALPSMSVSLRRMPYPSWHESSSSLLQGLLPSIISYCIFFVILEAINDIAEEKQKKIKIYMKTMGLTSGLHWFSYFTFNFLKTTLMCLIFVVVTILVIPGTSVFVVFIVCILFAAAAIWVAFFFSTLFRSANSVMLFTVVAWTLLFVMSSTLQHSITGLALKMICCLNVNMAVTYAINLFSVHKLLFDGATLGTLFTATADDPLTIGHVLCMLVFDALLFMLLTFYLDGVRPGDGSQELPFNFPFTKSYWCSPSAADMPKEDNTTTPLNTAVTEVLQTDIAPSIVIHRLTKEFYTQGSGAALRKVHRAVDNLSMNIYPCQITALLGQNGAGKTTTFSMLTGMLDATSGYATVNGLDTRFEMGKIQQMFGLCPQHNALFDGLSVREHLEFFCELKGRGLFNEDEMNELLQSLSLTPKVDQLSGTLSGGMKRKLSMCIALIGGSEVVILDEPTSGMDPDGRHEAWQLLQREKGRRTMLLTTHYMEEADLLGDRIAILADGRLRVDGTALFLKNHYEIGFHLKVEFLPASADFGANAQAVLEVMKLWCPSATLLGQDGIEAAYRLSISDRDRFAQLFAEMEEQATVLEIQSFGMSVGTMDDVFLKVGELVEAEKLEREAKNQEVLNENQEQSAEPTIEDVAIEKPNTGVWLFLQQIYAVLLQRYHFSVKEMSILCGQVLVPIGFMVIAINLGNVLSGSTEPQSQLSFGLSLLSDTTVPVTNTTADSTGLMKSYQSFLNSENISMHQLEGMSVDEFILGAYERAGGKRHVDETFLVGAEITDKLGAIGDFNNQKMHTAALSLNLIDNAYLKMANGDLSITTINHPLPPTKLESITNPSGVTAVSLTIAFILSLVVADCIVIPMLERQKNVRHLKLISGLSLWRYWLSTFIWDGAVCLLVIVEVMLVMLVLGGSASAPYLAEPVATVVTLVVYCCAALPFVYVLSLCFGSPTVGSTLCSLYIMAAGFLPVFAALNWLKDAWLVRRLLHLLSPHYAVIDAFLMLNVNHQMKSDCAEVFHLCPQMEVGGAIHAACCAESRGYRESMFAFVYPGIGGILVAMLLHGAAMWLVLYLIESGRLSDLARLCGIGEATSKEMIEQNRSTQSTNPSATSTDVDAERTEVDQLSAADAALIGRRLTKFYGDFLAVDKVSFRVAAADCFGLLGVNGAGKTTTFQMFTGENRPSDGDAYINGHSVIENWRQAASTAGYCPQFDAMLDELTVRQTLTLHCRLRGVPERQLTDFADKLMRLVDIRPHADKLTAMCSGGCKRRASLALALIGVPKVLLLDEPTAGVDPIARRVVWGLLADARRAGTAVVLTSHSMEECEALCTRLAIMVDGQFLCMGSTQHIKDQYGKGFTLMAKVANKTDIEGATAAVISTFPGSVVKSIYHTQLTFEVPRSEGVLWSQMYEQAERLANERHFVDYALSQTTLEQIFLLFSRQQRVKQLTTNDDTQLQQTNDIV